jgi:hypothetical protein
MKAQLALDYEHEDDLPFPSYGEIMTGEGDHFKFTLARDIFILQL